MHTVALDGFWMDQMEVTNAQFAQFLGEEGNQTQEGASWLDLEAEDCLIELSGERYQPKAGHNDHPAIEVSWYGAAAYCEAAGARLPTEAEWEYAARGPEATTYPWGDGAPECDKANYTLAQQGEGCVGDFAPVGSHPEGGSWCSALDMAGNAMEWVADWYGDYPSERHETPGGPDSGDKRVVRGGYWYSEPRLIRGSSRSSLGPRLASPAIGFRCARDAD